jgi:menaquinone-dependent protoporphyrinogen oxidase
MSRILIVYATGEGQTARIVGALASQLDAMGHSVQVSDLYDLRPRPDPAAYDAAIVAASVHAGRHQRRALRYVRRHRAALSERPTAFVSVSALAGATRPAGRQRALEQAQAFLRRADWQPTLLETVAGAFRASRLPWHLRLGTALARRFSARELERLGWPADLLHDEEFTDWDALRRFGGQFAAALPARAARRAQG